MTPGLVGTLAQPGIDQAPNILPIHCLSKWYRIVLYGIGCRSGHWHHGRLTPRRDRTMRERTAKKIRRHAGKRRILRLEQMCKTMVRHVAAR
jgi:hypothetical protein